MSPTFVDRSGVLDAGQGDARPYSTGNEKCGVGLWINDVKDKKTGVVELKVIDVLPDSDAARKGVRVGDVVVAVDLKAVQTREKNEILALIRGARGSSVRMDFRRTSGLQMGVVYYVDLMRTPLLGISMRSSQCTVKELQDLTPEQQAVFVVVHACSIQ
mmetsp:Transcript_16575/g.24359  ORF Transcript_16575/g.24359 Transcript_16575/m.24359 type:complete len:159 (+) Transcript_16575:25-501(+)|eukprot:CAMPEP_0173072770 /NCGR_PEP_ID=MMETSP1102-20130122/10011_1 /TAXON_ID=49646 /ORGANISM="Geminigera sp., Strain Caron Lab Isolate" /LENGTH=158 /DNA_ID=CAMNT_0013941495 /DNA_START=22 /DNA_END=498 /DNA_ORIENTATION=+